MFALKNKKIFNYPLIWSSGTYARLPVQRSQSCSVCSFTFPVSDTSEATHGINYSVSFVSRQDCWSYFASAESVHNLLLLAKTAVLDKRLPPPPSPNCPHDSVSAGSRILLTVLAGSCFVWADGGLGWKQEIADSLGGSQI